ncbi:hypothetical protein EVAR_32917_1 [Eumeta japonica]|uniref:Uncharacterized protein n=1 Tax=Eumeta variegata TaxID=151549 RepID=A0A4C2A2S8_EUMVA|nr:hypothetical protein EVAR_32917_1 [Eumeta japonica]
MSGRRARARPRRRHNRAFIAFFLRAVVALKAADIKFTIALKCPKSRADVRPDHTYFHPHKSRTVPINMYKQRARRPNGITIGVGLLGAYRRALARGRSRRAAGR